MSAGGSRGSDLNAGSLYEISVASGLQAVGGVATFLRKGLDHCAKTGLDPATVVDTRLHPDMLPFSYQGVCVNAYSAGAMDAARTGSFPPPGSSDGYDYAGLIRLTDETLLRLRQFTVEDVENICSAKVAFRHPEGDMPFALRDFFLSFALPNLYFHATTAYAILRMLGVPLGKLDFIGPMRFASGAPASTG